MISAKALEQTLQKLKRLESMLYDGIFQPVDTVDTTFYQSAEPLHAIPDASLFSPLPADGQWGGEGCYGWFRGRYTVPQALDGKALYLFPRIGGYEATLWVNGQMWANYATKEIIGSHGNHYAKQIAACPKAGEQLDLVLEYYAFHDMPGTSPFSEEGLPSYRYAIGPVDVCTQDTLFLEYWADLSTLTTLVDTLPDSSFRRADVLYTLHEVHQHIYYDAQNAPAGAFRLQLEKTLPMLKAQLAKQNGPSAPYVGLVGHSHMDTAWLWPLTETIKKCARTYANQLSLMAQYPEYRFVQSSAYHTEMVRENYPELFERIKEAIAQGRYEPNGAVWVECDCNLTGGEYMARQFVWGQRYTQEHFGYRSDAFWLPDTFGYSYAIPQIMKLSGVSYFLTTKMSWNDTTKLPYTSFWWQGVDGTRVLTHLNRTHIGPDPRMLNELTSGGDITGDPIREKPCSDMRLFSYGKGDGGGGPEFEMIEMSRRLGNLEGVARSSHISVSDFMHQLEETSRDLSVYAGEMYLELHRGTLTNQHTIKRNNRLAEIALHNLELLTVQQALLRGEPASGESIRPLMNTLLVNQFHDILPGTCINSVHVRSTNETNSVIEAARTQADALLDTSTDDCAITIYNPLGFARSDTLYVPYREGLRITGGYAQQRIDTIDGEAQVAVSGVNIPPLGSVSLSYEEGAMTNDGGPFQWTGDTLTTPHAIIRFATDGTIASYIDRANGRELRNDGGYAFNTFLMAEDVPASWDNWDIDADLIDKFAPTATLLTRQVVSQGPVELRIRSTYRLSERSSLTQDMIFCAASPMIVFDTVMDWQDDHRFLKTAFDTVLVADGVRHEIQFGHIRRSNHRSTDTEKARFEVCNHKYTDLSEHGYGIAILNDCKYGISVEEGSMWLSLHKGGNRPDRMGDHGRHACRYAFLPHMGDFSAESVVQPAYMLNYAPVQKAGSCALPSLLSIDAPNVIIETVKPCEDAERAYIVRLYEATGAYSKASLAFGHQPREIMLTNLLEEPISPVNSASLTFAPFEIKTIRVAY